MGTASGGRQSACLRAAERLMQLSIDHGLDVSVLLATLARDLADIEARQRELPCVDDCERLRLRAEHARRITARLVAAAAGMAALGTAMRAGFSRLLTEQLASGNHGPMDAFQDFFAVLPEQDFDFQRLLDLAIGRTEGALAEIAALLAKLADAETKPAASRRKSRLAARPGPAAAPVEPAAATG